MKKSITTLSALLLLCATLAACNSETPESTSTTNEQATEQVETSTQSNEQSVTKSSDATKTETEVTESAQQKLESSESTEPAAEQKLQGTNEPALTNPEPTENTNTLTYTSNNETFNERVIISQSTEMNYTIAHFENFSLVSEDPGVDQLYFNDNDALTMQIEVKSKEDVTFEDTKAAATETMQAIAPDATELDLSDVLAHHEDILNIAGYETIFDETDKVTKVVIERDEMLITLTIYDTVEADLQDAFLQMGLTIQ